MFEVHVKYLINKAVCQENGTITLVLIDPKYIDAMVAWYGPQRPTRQGPTTLQIPLKRRYTGPYYQRVDGSPLFRRPLRPRKEVLGPVLAPRESNTALFEGQLGPLEYRPQIAGLLL